ncbi:MAG: hypothetical protein IJT15_01900 [Rickettsiales bacterium]|nr:hypothetical protein [Rickettsiales bacterium]
MSDDEETLKSAFESNTEKRAVKDIFLAFLEVRKHQEPSEEICKKLDDAIYRFVREYLKKYNITEFVTRGGWFMNNLPRYIFSSYMPKYLEDCITHLTFGEYEKKFKNNDYNYRYDNKVFSQMNEMDDFSRAIRKIHYTYINFMTSKNNITDDDLKIIVQNIFKTAEGTIYDENNPFDLQYSHKYMKATGYSVPEVILLIAQKHINEGQSYT